MTLSNTQYTLLLLLLLSTDCDKTSYYDNTTSTCVPCPDNMEVRDDVTASDVTACVCKTGYYAAGSNCVGK